MDTSIVIVNWNTKTLLARCLASIAASGKARGSPGQPGTGEANVCIYEVLVVDNASTDGSVQMVKERFPWVRLITNAENVGFARANNQAIAQSHGRYVVLLNSDTEVHPGALETLAGFMEENPGAAGCGPYLVNPDGSLQPSCHPMLTPGREFWRLMFLDRLWHRATYPQAKWSPHRSRQVEVIKGACLLLRKSALDQVGLLDDRYFMYTEEMDLCYRLLHAGWELWWVPQAKVTHYGGASSKQAAEAMYIELYHSKLQFHRKFGGDSRANHFKRLLTIAYVPRWLLSELAMRFRPSFAAQTKIYKRLLAELPNF